LYLWERSTGLGMVINTANLVTVGYVAVFASIVAYFAWNRGVADIGAIRAGPFLHLLPVFSAVLAMIFLGEEIEIFHIPGIALIVSGIWLTTRRQRQAPP
ncbi:MAG: EamA family transporter, partial [Alphaproteobacteria bacterium]